MNYQPKFKEVGLAVALSLVVATPARSKILPLSTQQLSVSAPKIDRLNNYINYLDSQTYITEVGAISTLVNNQFQKGYYQPFPIFTQQISPFSPILEYKILEKKHQQKFSGISVTAFANSSTNNANPQAKTSSLINRLELTINNLQDEDTQALPTSAQELAILPPISEKLTLIDRYYLLKKKAENSDFTFNVTENRVNKQQHLNSNIQDQLAQKKERQTNKKFPEIEQEITSLAAQNQPDISFNNLKLATLPIQFNLTENLSGEQQNQVEQKQPQQINKIFRVNEIQQPITTAAALYQPDIIITNFSEKIRIAQQIIQVTNIRLNSTAEGLKIILETLDGEQLQVNTSTDGNTLIADIPNAVLSLADTEEFTVNNPATGITAVTARNVDFNSIRVTVVGEKNLPTASFETTDEGLTLTVIPVTEEIEVVIQATRRANAKEEDIPRSITVIPSEQIESQGSVSSTNNVTDILGRLVPGYGPPAAITRRMRSQTLRGRPALILIDGVVQNSNVGNDTELNTIDPSAIERIEVIRGPSALYGSGATGGIVNIITRNPSEGFQQEARIGISDFAGDDFFPGNGIGYNGRYGLSGTQGDFSWGISGSLNQNNRLLKTHHFLPSLHILLLAFDK